jgi:L,D-transpeptidase ErfK/SrfK
VDAVGSLVTYVTQPGDRLSEIARAFGLGFDELAAANPGLDPERAGAGHTLLLPNFHLLPDAPRRGIVINLAARRLYAFGPAGRLRTYPIAVAEAGHETPLGLTRIVAKRQRPAWTPTAAIRADQPGLPRHVPPGPDNPLGDHALYLGWPTILIHGTNEPDGIGRARSYGCVSLYPEHIAALFAQVSVGTEVRVVRQEFAVARVGDSLFLQVYPSEEHLLGLIPRRENAALTAAVRARVALLAGRHGFTIDDAAVEKVRWDRNGVPVDVSR